MKQQPSLQPIHSTILTTIDAYLNELKHCIETIDKKQVEKAIHFLFEAYLHKRRVFILGNGGSATTATHMASDLSKGTLSRVYDQTESRLRVISLTENVALITAYGNDLSYDDIFVQQLRSLVERDDLVIALSGSGNSENVIRAIAYAQECGAKTIGLLAFKTGGKLGGMVDCPIIINTKHYGPAEDMQLVLNHILTACFAKQKQHLDGSTDTPDNKSVPYR